MTEGTVDLETCDREPIHFIGAVQPHGALIAINNADFVIEFASENTAEFIGAGPNDILGRGLAGVIGTDNAQQLHNIPIEPSLPDLLKPWFFSFRGLDGTTIDTECLPHCVDGYIVLEFLHPEKAPVAVWEDELLRRGVIAELIKPGALLELADASARIIRDITGFDRVMIYKFAEDKHGEVIAESTNRPDSFLGLHYPASDIPDPARRHFLLNVMRSIPDINGTFIPIISRSGTVADAESRHPLDLTYSKLRAVAPVHVEYLNNMGVGASLSISLVTNNELWGLIACHHYGKRLVSSSRLRFAELLGGTTSALLQSIENTKQLEKSIVAEKTAYQIELNARSGKPLRGLIEDQSQELMQLFDAQGMLLMLDGECVEIGHVPKPAMDFANLRSFLVDGVATTSHLSSVIQMTNEQMQVAAGAALLDLSEDGRDYLVLLRSDFDQKITWAGKPEKITSKARGGATRLSPRGSFELWREERHGKSRPFDAMDLDAFRIIRRALFALSSLERERAALDAQNVAEAEETRLRHALLDAARANSLGELTSAIAHELNQPLSAVANFVNACRQEFTNAGAEIPERAEKLMDEAVAETTRAGDLVNRIRNFISRGDLNADEININDTVKQGVELAMVTNELRKLRVNLILLQDVPRIWADGVQLAQVVLNLVRNSITAMENSEKQVLTVEVIDAGDNVQVHVRDSGCGIAAEKQKYLFEPFQASTTKGMGIGLSLCRSIVEAHGGDIRSLPQKNGATFVFQLPKADKKDVSVV